VAASERNESPNSGTIDETDNGGSASCNECRNDAGICCAVECQVDGFSPRIAVEKGGWTINGKCSSNKRPFIIVGFSDTLHQATR